MRSLRSWLAGVVILACALIGPRSAAADGFGAVQKPVIPVSFFSHQGGWIVFLYPPSARERVGPLIAQADDVRAALGSVLGTPPLAGVEVRIARGPDEMATFAPQIGESSPAPMVAVPQAITYPALKLVVLSLGETVAVEPGELAGSFRRELGRVALHDAMRGRAVPSWFSEGFSTEFAGERNWSRWWLLFKAAVGQRIAPLSALDNLMARGGAGSALAIAEGADLVGFLLRPETRPRFAQFAELVRNGEPFAAALDRAFGYVQADLEKAWRKDLGERCLVRGAAVAAAVPVAVLMGIAIARSIRRRKARQKAGSTSRMAEGGLAALPQKRVHIVFSRREENAEPPTIPEAEIPRVEHEGEWHTLH
jgi:hypothetical protein